MKAALASRALGVAAGLLAAACATFSPPSSKTGHEPAFVEPAALPADRPGVALVLSSGSARGFAHVGVIKALEAHGLRPDIIVGSSAGSIVGALYASGLSAAQLERAVAELGMRDFNDFVLPGLLFLPSAMGLIRGEKLHRFIDERTPLHRIEEFPMRFGAVATDLATGEAKIFNAGDVGLAVRASIAVPGVITPARIDGRLYGDGQIASPLPVAAARRLGARAVIAVDVVYPPEDAAIYTAIGVLFQAYVVATNRIKAYESAQADALIVPELPRTTGQMSFGDREGLVLAGERAALAAIDRLRPLFTKGAKP